MSVHVFNIGSVHTDNDILFQPSPDERALHLGELYISREHQTTPALVGTSSPWDNDFVPTTSSAKPTYLKSLFRKLFDSSDFLTLPINAYVNDTTVSTVPRSNSTTLLEYLQEYYNANLKLSRVYNNIKTKLQNALDASNMGSTDKLYKNGDKIVCFCQFDILTTTLSTRTDKVVFEALVKFL